MALQRLHFVTQPNSKFSNSELVERACKGGARLIQLRIKNKSEKLIYSEAKAVKAICSKYNATFILNDYVEIAKELELDGVHLGKSDCSPIEARSILGDKAIIGGTANNLEDIKRLINAKVDYIGLGPFRFTKTKKKLDPVLGIEGYKTIIKAVDNYVCPPIYAIGGIKEKDIQPLLKTGIYGIAVSRLIVNSNDIQNEAKKICQLLS